MTSGPDQPQSQAQGQVQPERRLSPADVTNVRFPRATMLRPGYVDTEVDRVLARVADELGRLIAEKAQLRDEVAVLRRQVEAVEGAVQQPPSEQAVRILSVAQQTADSYVAEAEEFSRQVTSEARSEYEALLRQARENAGAIIQAAQEAAASMGPVTVTGERGDRDERDLAELQEQVAYLKAFGQACRTQLRSYLEALLSDVENEWGRADPAALPSEVGRPPAQRAIGGSPGVTATFVANTAAQAPPEDAHEAVPAGSGAQRAG